MILHVRDIAHADSDAQAQDVNGDSCRARRRRRGRRSSRSGTSSTGSTPTIAPRSRSSSESERSPIAVSALTGEGIDAAGGDRGPAGAGRPLIDLSLDGADGQGLHWLYEHTEVMAAPTATMA